eukprot:5451496-Prymnesium_polylepis.1
MAPCTHGACHLRACHLPQTHSAAHPHAPAEAIVERTTTAPPRATASRSAKHATDASQGQAPFSRSLDAGCRRGGPCGAG